MGPNITDTPMSKPQRGAQRRIGVLGGTFDPPHVGHLLLGEAAREQLQLDVVLYMPAGHPPHKQAQPLTSPAHRLAMTDLAIRDNASFATSAIDVERPAPHYTSTLRPLLEKEYPGARFWLLIGSDSLRDLPRWHEPQKVVTQWTLAVLPRPNGDVDWSALEEAIPGLADETVMLDGPAIAVSSTQIRRWKRAGRSLRYVVPDAVLHYIEAHDLYAEKG